MKRFFPLYKGLLGLVFAGYFLFGFHHLTQFVTADEHYWLYKRIPQYWEAVSKQEWKKTFINDKPGVSLALVSGVGLLFEPHPDRHFFENNDRLLVYDTASTESLLFAFRAPILIINGFFLFGIFLIIRRLTDQWIALWTVALMALSPILLGISQIMNPDALLWSFSTVALFSFYSLLRFEEKKFLFLTIVFTGFAILTKYVAIILLPFYCALTVFRFLTEKKPVAHLSRNLKKDLCSLVMIAFGSAGIFSFFLPAIFIDPKYLAEFLATVPDKLWFALAGGSIVLILLLDTFAFKSKFLFSLRKMLHLSKAPARFLPAVLAALFLGIIAIRNISDQTLFDRIPFDIKDITDARYSTAVPNFFEAFVLEWNPLVFSFTPILLLGLFVLVFALLRKRSVPHPFLVQTLIFFSFAYAILLVFSNVLTTPRYSIILYPLFALIAAIGFRYLTLAFPLRRIEIYTTLIILFGSFSSLAAISPFSFNYTNALLPKDALIQDAWGYGGYEAAQYLNSLPDAQNLTVWTDYYGTCEFFVGKCLSAYTFDPHVVRPDYYILTRRGKIRYLSRLDRWERLSGLTAYEYYDIPNPDWQLHIGNRPENFIKVVKVDYTLRAALITDIDHCPSREAVSTERLDTFLSFSQERDVDFIASLGDNASHELRNCSETVDSDARFIADYLRSLGKPTHLVLGDHDIASSVPSYQSWLETTGKEGTYYSYNRKGVHIIILDTVLGGEPMREPCDDDPTCAGIDTRLSEVQTLPFARYQEKYSDAATSKWRELIRLKKILSDEKKKIDLTRSFGSRDRGRISEEELAWLKKDLEETSSERVLVLSDHPLFPFSSDKKRYDIVNGGATRSILEQSGKQVTAISGEAHLWHEETLNGIRYSIVDEFRKADGSWAYFTWDDDGFRLEQITRENLTKSDTP